MVEYYLAIKNNGILIHGATWLDTENILSEKKPNIWVTDSV
jgi:hypothetical protein